ncbi:MAG TPA: hypothetical protein VGB84_07280 [Arachidicoccus sp.]
MKKIVSAIVAMFLSVFAITVVSAQHEHHGSFGANRGGGSRQNAHTSRSVSHERNVVAYRGGGYNHPAYNNHGGGGYVRSAYARPVGGRRVAVPWGTAHRYGYGRPVYFPAYHLYYNPYRCGYEYWSGGRWLFSSVLPAFLAGINLAAADMSYIDNLPSAEYYPVAPVMSAPGVGVNIHIGL